MSDVGYHGHTLHFRLDSHFLIGQNEILLTVIKGMLLAVDRVLVTYSAVESIRSKFPTANEPLSQLT